MPIDFELKQGLSCVFTNCQTYWWQPPWTVWNAIRASQSVTELFPIYKKYLNNALGRSMIIPSSHLPTVLYWRLSNLCIPSENRKQIHWKFQPFITSSTNHKTVLKFWLMGYFVIGWNSYIRSNFHCTGFCGKKTQNYSRFYLNLEHLTFAVLHPLSPLLRQ